MALSVVSVPIILDFLGSENYGVWQTILSILAWVSLTNFGLGNGLRNFISLERAKKSISELNFYVNTTILLSLVISFVVLCFLIIILYNIELSAVFKNYLGNYSSIKISLVISIIFFCLNLVTGIFYSVFYGFEKSHYVSGVTFVFNFLFFLSIYLTNNFSYDRLIYVSFLYGCINFVITFFSGLIFFRTKQIITGLYFFKKNLIKPILFDSSKFFILQIAMVLLFSMDNFLVSYLLNFETVTNYSILQKVNMILISIASIVLVQVWNMVASAKGRGDIEKIKNLLGKLRVLMIFPLAFVIIFCFVYDKLFFLWLGRKLEVSNLLVLLLGLYSLLHIWNAINVNVTNGLGILKNQIIAYFIGGIVFFLLSYIFVVFYNLNIEGIALAKVLSLMIPASISTIDLINYFKINSICRE